MNANNIKNILEAALMVSSQPLTLDKLETLFAKDAVQPDRDALRNALAELAEECNGRGVELKEVASGWRYQVRADYADWVNRLWEEKPPRYSRALLETLAIIAYRQPITRGEIEDIRGVSVSANIIRTLQEREWIKSVGHRDVPGKPELLATTKEFLDYFNLKKLSDLPTLAEIRDLDEINPDLFADLEKSDSQYGTSDSTGEDSEDNETDAASSETEEDTDTARTEAAEEDSADEQDTVAVNDTVTDDNDADIADEGLIGEAGDEPDSEADDETNETAVTDQDATTDASSEEDNDDEDDDTNKVVQFYQ